MKKRAKKTLTSLQKRFCDILLLMELSGKVNQAKAYILAGSKCKLKSAEANASRMLRNDKVLAHLTRARARVKGVVEKTEADIIARYQDLGWADLDDYGTWDTDGFKLKSSKEIPKNKMGALRSITVDEQEYTNKKGRKGLKRRVKVELHNPKAAVDSLAKIKGLMKGEVEEAAKSLAVAMHEAMKEKE